jgi:hypothetical protein
MGMPEVDLLWVVLLVGALALFAKLLDKALEWLIIHTTRDPRKVNVLDLAVEDYILRLLAENRQLRELLKLREKDWEELRKA